jgi:hypothetical protein
MLTIEVKPNDNWDMTQQNQSHEYIQMLASPQQNLKEKEKT